MPKTIWIHLRILLGISLSDIWTACSDYDFEIALTIFIILDYKLILEISRCNNLFDIFTIDSSLLQNIKLYSLCKSPDSEF